MGDLFSVVARQVEAGDGVLIAVLVLLSSWIVCRVALWRLSFAGRPRRILDGYARAAGNIGGVLGLEQAYELTRGQIPINTDVALLHAYRLLDLEWSHGFFIEERLQHFFLHFRLLMMGIDLFYILGHVGVTIGVLIWVYFRHRAYFPFVRNLLMVVTGIALIAFWLYPTAPPRLLPNYGFVDPLQANNLIGPGGEQPSSYTYDPYAAMPSLHVAYAMVSSWAIWVCRRDLWPRLAAALYPAAMAATVLISGNHWVLDVVGAVITVLVARLVLWSFARLHDLVAPLGPRLAHH